MYEANIVLRKWEGKAVTGQSLPRTETKITSIQSTSETVLTEVEGSAITLPTPRAINLKPCQLQKL